MQVRMRAFRVMQAAGVELSLHAGQVYDLSGPVAEGLIASGAAEPAERAITEPDETKPAFAPENNRRRMRR